ncbi:unnamed protein product [Dracunculus medinensis]|uniref:glutamate synthase (ferredoxin) n=1 Tax=Dracunculus medinensis TaxID=318479 RepID=A0A0N4UQJ9_DRAME|nr:unnamed protein product [Dracunculus medinensis]
MVILTKKEFEDAEKKSLWIKNFEKDSCGVGFIASIDGISTHRILKEARIMLERMAHRGACSCDNDSGDGAGVLTAIPDKLYRNELLQCGDIELPQLGCYATGILFLNRETYKQAKEAFMDLANGCDLKVIAWRRLLTHNSRIGFEARKTEPVMRQVFVSAEYATEDKIRFEKNIYILRKQASIQLAKQEIECYIVSLDTSIIVYKGQFTTHQLYPYYADLTNPEFISHIAIVHSRYSTNTFPAWSRAQPNRLISFIVKPIKLVF